jgi:hypothetical protein
MDSHESERGRSVDGMNGDDDRREFRIGLNRNYPTIEHEEQPHA